MSTIDNRCHPISIRTPSQILKHSVSALLAPDRNGRVPQQSCELASYRIARLEAEVLTPTRGIAQSDLRLQRMVSAYVKLAITDPGIMTLMSGSQRVSGDAALPPPASNGIDRFLSTLQEDLSRVIGGQERTPTIDPGMAVQSLLGIIHWGVSSHRAEERLSHDEASAQITFLALHGLVSQPPSPPTRRLATSRRWHAA